MAATDGVEGAGEAPDKTDSPPSPVAARSFDGVKLLKGLLALVIAAGAITAAFMAVRRFDEPPLPINPPGSKTVAPDSPGALANALASQGAVISTPTPTRMNLLVWAESTPKAAGNPGLRPLAFLDQPDDTPPMPASNVALGQAARETRSRGILCRELVRQAILQAIGETADATTRDAVLGERGRSGKADLSLVVELEFPRDRPSTLVLRRESGEAVYSVELCPTLNGRPDPAKLAEVMDRLAAGPLAEALVKEGLRRTPAAKPGGGRWPDGVETKLATMTAAAQFAALRQLSDSVRLGGTSFALESGLARGYANLAVLTEHHWDPAHKVYAARGLLHGRKSARLAGDLSPGGLRALAYAEALAGRPVSALEHLQEARNRAKRDESKPGWVEVIRAFCERDLAALDATNGLTVPLARLLTMLSVEVASGVNLNLSDVNSAEILAAAQRVVDAEPECFRAYDTIFRFSLYNPNLKLTRAALDGFEKTINDRVRSMPGVDPPLAEGDPVTVLSEPSHDEDAAQPSLAALARYVREARFNLVWRRRDAIVVKLAGPDEEYVSRNRQLVIEHPLLPFLDGQLRGVNAANFDKLGDSLAKTDIEASALPLILMIQDGVVPLSQMTRLTLDNKGRWLRDIALMHGDETPRDLTAWIRSGLDWARLDAAQRLLAVDPASPLARAVIVDMDGKLDAATLASWEKEPKAAASVLLAIGRRHAAAKKYDDAIRLFNLAIERSPDRMTYRALADVYKEQGQKAKWREALDNYLRGEESGGLEHAKVRDEIANSLLADGNAKEACVYADAAAETYAAWAMITACFCHEALQEWDEAEMWIRRTSTRYAASATQWFYWCKRTGHGDVNAAYQAARNMLDPAERLFKDFDSAFELGSLLILGGQEKRALELTRKAQAVHPNPVLLLRIATLADGQGDVKLRDESLAKVAIQLKITGPISARACELLRSWLARPDADTVGPDLAAFDDLIGNMKNYRGNFAYTLAVFLDHHGRKPEALEYMAVAAQEGATTSDVVMTIAKDFLRTKGIVPEKVTPRKLRPLVSPPAK